MRKFFKSLTLRKKKNTPKIEDTLPIKKIESTSVKKTEDIPPTEAEFRSSEDKETKEEVPSPQGFTLEMVAAISIRKDIKRIAPSDKVHINCPPRILTAFKNSLKDTKILGTKFKNPYTGKTETIPSNPEELTARHLHLIARNEVYNIDGKMRTNLYNGLLTDNQIATIRCLVKCTNIAGIVNATHYGIEATPIEEGSQKTIVIDQCGLQWQRDLRNTGGMFFYPDNPSEEYQKWQEDTYKMMFGTERPKPDNHSVRKTWNHFGTTFGILDLKQVSMAIAFEFKQALEATIAQGDYLESSDKINFKYLKAGIGFFARGISSSSSGNDPDLNLARFNGIILALEEISSIYKTDHTILGKIKRIELPFSQDPDNEANKKALKKIETLVQGLGLEWGGVGKEDALMPRKGYVNATTNCGDPHALFGNEGGLRPAADACISSNLANPNILNPGCNMEMKLVESQNYILSFGITEDTQDKKEQKKNTVGTEFSSQPVLVDTDFKKISTDPTIEGDEDRKFEKKIQPEKKLESSLSEPSRAPSPIPTTPIKLSNDSKNDPSIGSTPS